MGGSSHNTTQFCYCCPTKNDQKGVPQPGCDETRCKARLLRKGKTKCLHVDMCRSVDYAEAHAMDKTWPKDSDKRETVLEFAQ